MASSITLYNDGKMNVLDGDIDLTSDTIKISLHTSAYTPDIDAHTTTADLSNELAATGNYSTGGATLANKAVAADDTNDRAYWDADDVTWTALTPSAAFRYGVLYSSTASNNLIAYVDFGANQDPGGNNFVIQWAATASGAIFYI